MDNKNFRNNLKNETSPYLLQHADNPVDWYPWNKESLELSKKLDKPIFLSIGYSTCHWCHVMAHESFENEETAKVMNELFVNIKVDKEERPDIDKVYMQYLHATKQGGGWPMSIWLTPELTPIIGGTYFPPTAKYGRHGFADLCKLISNAWNKEKKEILLSSQNTIDQMKHLFLTTRAHNDETTFDQIDLEQTCEKLVGYFLDSFDGEEGGFGNAPKFPRVSLFESIFQLAEFSKKHEIEGIDSVLNAAFFTLKKMALGGMNDQLSPVSLSGSHGFHRYSVDKFFHVPHYEKMMYDQAQLLSAYTSAYKISLEKGNKENSEHFKNVVLGILNYISSEMTQTETGAVFTAEDADSLPDHQSIHPSEGAYYVWEYKEVLKILDNEKDFNIFSKFYGLKPEGNSPPGSDPHEELVNKNTLKQFYCVSELSEEMNIPADQITESLMTSKKKLFEERQKRPNCFKDTKILCYLNAMTACSLVYASNVFNLKEHLDHAVKIFHFISKNFYCSESQTLYRNMSETKERRIEGFSDDYTWTVKLSLDLYERLGDFSYLKFALLIQQRQFQLFYDIDNNGGFYDNHGNDKTVLMRVKEEYDGAEPSSSSVSLLNISRLYKITKDPFYKEKLESSFLLFRRNLEELPNSLPYMCKALLHYSQKQTEIVLIGNPHSAPALSALEKIHSSLWFLNKTLLFSDGGEGNVFLSKFNEALQHVSFDQEFVRIMVCEGVTCRMPLDSNKDVEWKELEKQLLEIKN